MGDGMKVEESLKVIKNGNIAKIYLVLGKEQYLQKKVRNFLLNEMIAEEDQDLNVGIYNMEEVLLQTALADAESLPFFGDKRLVFVDQPYFLTGERDKARLEHNIDSLQDYLTNPSETTILVMFAPYEKLDSRKKVVKILKKVATVIDVQAPTPAELKHILNDRLQEEEIHMTSQNKELLLEKTDYNLSILMNELDKLALAAYDSKEISVQMMEDLVSKTLEQNIFELNQAVLDRNGYRAISIYRDLLLQKEDPIKLNAILLNQIRLLLQLAYLSKQGFHEGDIQKKLGIHPYRIKLAMQQVRKYPVKLLEGAYAGLVEIEYEMKTGRGIKEIQFEIFILKFCQQLAEVR